MSCVIFIIGFLQLHLKVSSVRLAEIHEIISFPEVFRNSNLNKIDIVGVRCELKAYADPES